MVLVTGATGNTGRPLVAELVQRGAPVRAFVRDRARAEAVLPPGVELVEGDLDRPDTLAAAVAGVDRLYVLSAPTPRLPEQEREVLEAAARAGVQHVVKHSAFGASTGAPMRITRWHAEAERMLRRSGLAWTILQPNMFMQNFLQFAPGVAATGELRLTATDGRVSVVDCRDVAAVAAAVLTGSGHEGRTYVPTGPEALTLAELAARLGAAIGRNVRCVDTPGSALRESLIATGAESWLADDFVAHLDYYFVAGRAAAVTREVLDLTGRPPRSFEQFAKESASAFRGGAVPAPGSSS